MAEHRLQWKDVHGDGRRRDARELLRRLALAAPDPFTLDQARAGMDWTEWLQAGYDRAFDFIRQRGFIAKIGVVGNRRVNAYELTEQAIRWLAWIGFDWASRRAAGRLTPQTTSPSASAAFPEPDSLSDHQRGRVTIPAPESTPPLVVLFPHASHRGINDEPSPQTATRPTASQRRTKRAPLSVN